MKFLFLFLNSLLLNAALVNKSVCASGCDYSNLQTALTAVGTYQDSTSCIEIFLNVKAGETFSGNFTIPYKACKKFIYVRSSRFDEFAANTRINSNAKMPTITTGAGSTNPTIQTDTSASYWAFQGLEITMPDLGASIKYVLFGIGTGSETTIAQLPKNIIVKKCYIHGLSQKEGPVHAILLAGQNIEISDSRVDEAHATGADAQAVYSAQTLGPVLIKNNLLAAAGENIIFGGGGGDGNSFMSIPGASQSFITIIGNNFTKYADWKVSSGTVAPTRACLVGEYYHDTVGAQWYICTDAAGTWGTTSAPTIYVVKNLLEFKDGRNIYIAGNIFGPSWNAGQGGNVLILNQSGNAPPDSQRYNIQNVVFTGNQANSVNMGVGMGNLNYLVPDGNTFMSNVNFYHNIFNLFAPDIMDPAHASHPIPFAWHIATSINFSHNTSYNGNRGSYTAVGDLDDADPTLKGTNYIISNVFDNNNNGFLYWFSWAGGANSHCWGEQIVTYPGASTSFGYNAVAGTANFGNTCNAGSGSMWPTTGTSGAAITDILNDPANGDFSIKGTFTGGLNSAADGLNMGALPSFVTALTSKATNGNGANSYLDFKIDPIYVKKLTSTTQSIKYTYASPVTASCTELMSTNVDMSSPILNVSGPSGERSRAVQTRTLTVNPNTLVWFQLTCGTTLIKTSFTTSN